MTPPFSPGAADLSITAEPTQVAPPLSGPQLVMLPVAGADSPGAVTRRANRYERLVKPVVDRVGALTLLVALLPVMVACALAVALTMGRPVLLRQQRVGHHGRRFGIYKFRTMTPSRRVQQLPHVGPDRRQRHKSPNDPRVTPVGRFLRTWSLDELPQLFNVLAGDMSLVGPRPELVDIVERYAPWQHLRHQVKPGITGMWQVHARDDRPMHELTELDLVYLNRVTPGTDVRILLLTVPAALGLRRGF